ncbi:MAG: 5-formyltetrahydrofolate cyclo-ligase [Kiloniellaceae bacterium]
MADEDETPNQPASPTCYAGELDAETLRPLSAEEQARQVAGWRRAERARLIALRLARPAAERDAIAAGVAQELDRLVEPRDDAFVSLYWPFRGELDLRGWMRGFVARGGRVTLPVVVAKGQPLIFREWRRGIRMTHGVWKIPIPAEGPEVVPSVVIAPLVGHDPQCYRLGYGGGFFDRTLAAHPGTPLKIGVGDGSGAIASIYPQAHDIPMDVIVTEAGQQACRG